MNFAASQRLRWLGIWETIPANAQGALWMLLGGFCFSIMSLVIKYLGQELDSFQLGFIRAVFGVIVVLPFVFKRGIGSLRTKVFKLHFFRAVVGISGMLSIFYAVTHLPLADAVALTFTRPLFLILLAVLFLGEIIRWRRWLATGVGFLGVLVMVQADGEFSHASFVALFGAFMVALVSVFLKKLSRTEDPITMMFYFGVIGASIAFIPALFVWQTPTWQQLAILGGGALFGSGANYCAIRAFSVAEATAVAPFDYMRLVFSGLFGFLVFSEIPTLWMLTGASIIVASSLYIVRREAGLKKAQKQPIEQSVEP
ncbi:DMT family transporter [Sneathiella sp.]|jgi:drug/metabolite transporter (DMT)-like permease|uniref:DMT family transporter n=1 Tax=Sneathiella sp. TaxID=1964365 RepID=UPI0039E550FA